MKSHTEHRAHAPTRIRCAVFTVSDSRTAETDSGGDLLCAKLVEAGHEVVTRALYKDEPEVVWKAVKAAIEGGAVDAVLTTGGTGIGPRDSTYEAIERLLDKTLPGFGELFRMLSYADIGPAAMLSRATAGVAQGRVLVILPGSPDAVRLAMDKLVVPELGHMVKVAR